MKAVVTGGAGFIGSSMSESLARKGWEVTILDSLRVGSKENLAHLFADPTNSVRLVEGDCTRPGAIRKVMRDCNVVFHFAANPEVRMELNNPVQCFRHNIFATHNVLEAFSRSKADLIVFASTSAVYGEAKTIPTPENYSPLEPISVYGASKLAGEALVASYCHTFNKQGIILRLANVVGPRSTHGVVGDFIERLSRNSQQLSILGDGTQNKSYIYIDDCINAVLSSVKAPADPVAVFNVGSDDSISVKEIGITVASSLGLSNVNLKLEGGLWDGRGWIGDVKTMLLDISKLKSTGWTPSLNSREAIERTVKKTVAMKGKALTTQEIYNRGML